MTAPAKANLLLVDDEPRALAAMQQLLEGPDRTVVAVGSGRKALREILTTEFALVVLDIRMPGLDGFETARLIRQRGRSRHTPIVFLTAAFDDMPSMFRGYELGAVDYLTKPVDHAVLKSKVAVFIELYKRRAELAQEVAQRRQAENELQRINAELEDMIRERTTSLIAANEALQKEIESRKGLEEDLLHAKHAAETANLAKSAFLARMSHEIRTPMNAVIGMTDIALRTDLTSEQREYLSLAKSAGESLLTIISDILDFSKIEAGRLEMETIPFSLRENVSGTLKALAFQAHQKGLELACEISPGVPDAVLADPTRLRQIVSNLVGNAIKFTERGEITVWVEAKPDEDGAAEATYQFAVSDTGVGIPEDKKQMIFAPFVQADSSTTRLHGGAGLGLAIVTRLVEMMGGNIWVESNLGGGSTFYFTLRLALQRSPPAASDAVELRAPGSRRLDILVVEDDPISRRMGQIVLEKEGHTVTVAENGSMALEVLRESRFDLILMDLEMPRVDGIETTAEIRRREDGTGEHVPIIALTAHAMAGQRERCLAAGMDGYLVKPIRPARLLEAVVRLGVMPIQQATPAQVARVALDRAALLERVGGDPKLLGEIAALFVSNRGRLMADLRSAMANDDRDGLARTLHTLLGMLRNLAANSAQDLVRMLQALDLAKERERAETIYVMLEQELQALEAELANFVYETSPARSRPAQRAPPPSPAQQTPPPGAEPA